MLEYIKYLDALSCRVNRYKVAIKLFTVVTVPASVKVVKKYFHLKGNYIGK